MTDILQGPMNKVSMGYRNKIHLDSIPCSREEQLQRDYDVLHTQLITVDEEMGIDDITLLKFICRDFIGVSRLENMKSGLDIFNNLIKQALITPEDVNFLLECLGLIHRYDLIGKLGFDDIDSVKSEIARFHQIPKFRKLLLEVAEDLDESELSRLKFLLSSTIRKKRLQDCRTVLDLFVFMEKEHLLAHQKTDLLTDMLKNINRNDLVCRIQGYSDCQQRNHTENEVPLQNVRNHTAKNTPRNAGQIPAKLMTVIIENVATEDKWTVLAIELGFSNDEIRDYEKSNPNKILCVRAAVDNWCRKFRNQREIAPKLSYILEKLNFKTLKEELLKFQETTGSNQNPAPEGETQDNTAQPMQQNLPNTGAINQPLVFPVIQPLPEMQNGQQQRVEVQAIKENQRNNRPVAADSGEQLPVYPMSKRPRGWCVIINNRDFYVNINDNQATEMLQRSGTDVDAQSLQHVFETLGFIVRRRDNLTDTQMIQFLIDVARNVDHTNFECFVCCILTHGVLNHLYGTNGRLVSIKDLTSMFQANRCPTLVGKPKLFFLQACQGCDKMTGGENGGNIQRDAGVETDNDKEIIPNESDFLIGYATAPGYVSFRSRTHGSWYIRKLCELLEKLSHREDLMSILVQVNNEVSKANAKLEDGVYKQTPAPLVTLRKKLYFL